MVRTGTVRCFAMAAGLLVLFLGAGPAAARSVDCPSTVAGQMLDDLEDSIHIRRIGFDAIKGDDGSVLRALKSALDADRRFEVIARDRLQLILAEQGFQLGDLVDRGTRVSPGMIKGVEGILTGEVLVRSNWLLSRKLTVYVEIIDVQAGRYTLAGEYSCSSVSPYRPLALGVLAGAMILGGCVLLVRRGAVARRRSSGARLDARRNAIGQALTWARDGLQSLDLKAADCPEGAAGMIERWAAVLRHVQDGLRMATLGGATGIGNTAPDGLAGLEATAGELVQAIEHFRSSLSAQNQAACRQDMQEIDDLVRQLKSRSIRGG